jgi:hypothetical protein
MPIELQTAQHYAASSCRVSCRAACPMAFRTGPARCRERPDGPRPDSALPTWEVDRRMHNEGGGWLPMAEAVEVGAVRASEATLEGGATGRASNNGDI